MATETLTIIYYVVSSFFVGLLTMYYITSKMNLNDNKNSIKNDNQTTNNKQLASQSLLNSCKSSSSKKTVRIYVDGCWDVMHSGHYNAIRQAKALGDVLVVGVHSDREITLNKREPVMNNEQRMAAVNACKWVDEVQFGVPYSPSPELVERFNCDYIAHGDDIPIGADGHSAYHAVVDKLKIFRRTPGVSTTHLIQRLIDAANHDNNNNNNNNNNNTHLDDMKIDDKNMSSSSSSSWSSFLASSSRISAFSNSRVPSKDDTVIYIDGIFDLFHIGHISALRAASSLGTYLYVGLYDDETVRRRKGKYFPLMNLQERVLNVLSCKYVDDVLIGSPWNITSQILKSLNISYVVTTDNTEFAKNEYNRYNVPKEMGIYKYLNTDNDYTTNNLMKRIIKQKNRLEQQNKNRVEKAKKYVNDHTYVAET